MLTYTAKRQLYRPTYRVVLDVAMGPMMEVAGDAQHSPRLVAIVAK
jgi:hypothetical protein